MDQETRSLFQNQTSVNKSVLELLKVLITHLDRQQGQISQVWEFLRFINGELPAGAPEMPSAEDLAKQAADIAELKRILALEPDKTAEEQ